jgi:2-C-methyl-D-erythritol 2,4-cyclodiphosphate synthase
MKIGHGYDAHAFQEGGKLIIGGVHIDYPKGLKAHSDGDVLIHALCDALLGAVGLGDIGKHFPDSKEEFKDIDSRQLLRQVIELLEKNKLKVGNADMTIIAQAPKMAAHIDAMKKNLSEDMQVDAGQVNVKATTTEGMGFTGRREGVSAHAVVLLVEV